MNFYIKQIKLWFYHHPDAKSYMFFPDKVNVITGDSSTGKSSILRVIDYCLLSKESGIVDDVINENVSWYGMIFHLNGKDYSIARRSPRNGIVKNAIYWAPDTSELPDGEPIPSENVSRPWLEKQMDNLFGIDGDIIQDGKKTLQLHFRHMLMLSYLTEDIIATMNTYFDVNFFSDLEYARFIQSIVKYALGTNEAELRCLEDKLNVIQKTITQEERNRKNDEKNRASYNKNLNDLIQEAKELGLVTEDSTPDGIIENIRRYVKEFEKLRRSHAKLRNIGELYAKRNELDNSLKEFKQLMLEYKRSVKYALSVKDSMMPMEFLMQNINEQALSEDTIELYRSLEDTFKRLKSSDFKIDKLPVDFERNRDKVKQELNKVDAEIESLKKASEIVLNPDILYRAINIETKFKSLKQKSATYCGDVRYQELIEELNSINSQIEILNAKNQESLKALNSDIQSYFDQQDGISDSYRNSNITFNIENLTLKLRKEGEYHKIKNVGSKSNFMFLHLCFYCGMHQYLRTLESSKVANFMFIDQPSIPYYSNDRRHKESDDNSKLTSKDDETKLKKAFKLLEGFMHQNTNDKDEHFQIILVEHADPSYWEDLKHFETRYIFKVGKHYGLIPEYVDERRL